MKKIILLFACVLLTTVLFAQEMGPTTQQWNGSSTINNNIYRNGNVGIGNTSPSEKLDVTGTVKGQEGVFLNPLPDGSVFFNTLDRNTKCKVIAAGTHTNNYDFLFNVYDFPASNLNSNSQVFISAADRNNSSRWRFYADTDGATNLRYYNKSQSEFFKLSEDNDFVHMALNKPSSVVTIGTSSYQDGVDIYRLSVNGKVRAESVKVYTNWADFVFESDYNLPTLSEVESYIDQNGHLKDIPSAEEVEQNGIELGEMNKLLLQKIEELTLYLIEKDKEIKTLIKEVNQMKKENK